MRESPEMIKAQETLAKIREKKVSADERSALAVKLASLMLHEAHKTETSKEKKLHARLARLMNDPQGKVFTTALTDQAFRSHSVSKVANQVDFLLGKHGIPRYLSLIDRLKLSIFKLFNTSLPSLLIPLMRFTLRKDMSTVILPGEEKSLGSHMEERRRQGVRINLNHLGEAVLGEAEAKKRLNIYLHTLSKPEVEYVSVKISTIFSQINLLDWAGTLEVLSDRLRELYRMAITHPYICLDGSKKQKFVNLDMEEYRDLHFTADLFCKILDEPEFYNYSAGIVLQAYLPDSHMIQQTLTKWAVERKAQGRAPIKIRIVKGANLAMEKVESSLKGWPQAPYTSKGEVDANFKRMVTYGCIPEHAKAAHLGIGSHNLFDIAYAMLLREENGVQEEVCFEMLEGMATHISRVVKSLTGDLLLYCPAAKQEEFQNAMAYLIRRLDENTGPENFLRHSFELTSNNEQWKQQVELFERACLDMNRVSTLPRRTQNRLDTPRAPLLDAPFQNEPDTDWSLANNRQWAAELLLTWKDRSHSPIPVVIGGKEIYTQQVGIGKDPSRSPSSTSQPFYTFSMADSALAELALQTAEKAQASWAAISVKERSHLLATVAQELRKSRQELIGVMIGDGGKTIPEADTEISEAIDFAEYYRRSAEELDILEEISWEPKGTILVSTPWNFPCAIPAGGILAALATGNCVIFKPSRDTVLVAWVLAGAFWRAGISKEVLQFLPCPGVPVGNKLVSDSRVAAVVLTGSTETARHFAKIRPGLDLLAETGGKNGIILSSLCDRDLAIKDLIQSAFGHSGQKCSAASLAICEGEVYDDPDFLDQLRDAAASLPVGSAWDPKSRVTPLIHPPGKDLLRALTELDPGESWLLKPGQDPQNPNLWSPGIRLGVKEGSWCHQTEFFGPVLSLMRAENLDHAIRLANGTPYGLTAGLHSLNERDYKPWINSIEAGNLYINRGITGAIVRRQPFGGTKASSFGPGAKAGGPNYLIEFMHASKKQNPHQEGSLSPKVLELSAFLEEQLSLLGELSSWEATLHSYAYWWALLKNPSDLSQLRGQDNFFYHIPHKQMDLRLLGEESLLNVGRTCAAALTCGTPLKISTAPHKHAYLRRWTDLQGLSVIEETEEQFVARVQEAQIKRLRLLTPPSPELLKAAAETGTTLLTRPVLAAGRLELLHFLRELSLSVDYHRYGNLGDREEK